ncbi:signal recognition particle subunit SRP68 [Bacillus rossius redtenbacheri]|uniref:signal recognition particle subunit SRP68 n=1 Tax=Bacillus rossius redtenbacheri TaxID=93214 RepID=UPI002FDDAF88
MVVKVEDTFETKLETDAATVNEPELQPIFSIEILKIIKDAQQQHGLRHSDYQRYRGYCSRRLRRLRKVLHVTQGDKRHFKKKIITESLLKDEKFVHIPLMMAERAWSFAMQLRQEANTEPRKKFHLVSRLRKAVTYALQLQNLCESNKCDVRTRLEAQAYVAWISGSLQFELQQWRLAMESLKKSQMVYEKLAQALPEQEQAVYRQRVEELAPSLRYCAYNIGDDSAMDDLLELRSHGQGDMLANLDSLIVQTRERGVADHQEVVWRGRAVVVRPERVRLFLMANQDADKSLGRLTDNTEKISLLETLLMDCKDAISSVRDELKSDQASKGRAEAGAPVSPLQYLLSYLVHIKLTRTIQRTLIMVDSARAALLADTEGSEGRKARPQDMTRLYEIVLQNYAELQQLPGLETDAEYQRGLEADIQAYRAFRCFYIAQSLAGAGRWPESLALYQRADQYAVQALRSSVPHLSAELERLRKDVEGHAFSVRAHGVLEEEVCDDDQPLLLGARTTPRIKKVGLTSFM